MKSFLGGLGRFLPDKQQLPLTGWPSLSPRATVRTRDQWVTTVSMASPGAGHSMKREGSQYDSNPKSKHLGATQTQQDTEATAEILDFPELNIQVHWRLYRGKGVGPGNFLLSTQILSVDMETWLIILQLMHIILECVLAIEHVGTQGH